MYSTPEPLYFKMAALYVLRRKGRSVLIALMIALSLIGLLVMEGMYEGMMVQITQNAIKTGSGAVSLQHRNFRSDDAIANRISKPQDIVPLLADEARVRSFVQRLGARGLAATAGYSQGVSVTGMDLADEAFHSELDRFIIDGKYTFGKRLGGALIGYRLARKLKARVGNKVIVSMQDRDNEIVSVPLKIEGILKTNNTAIDRNGILMDLERMRELCGVEGATEIAVLLYDRNDAAAVKHAVQSRISASEVAVYTYRELYPSLYEGEAMMQVYNQISSAFIFIVASLGIFGVVLVSVLERVREFGIMMALGTPFRAIARLVLYESLLITMGGYAAGALIGGGLLWYFHHFGLNLLELSDAFAIFGMDSRIQAVIRYEYFTAAFASVLLATLAASAIPIRTLKKRRPIQSINELPG